MSRIDTLVCTDAGENEISFRGFDDDFSGVCHQLRRPNEYWRGTAFHH